MCTLCSAKGAHCAVHRLSYTGKFFPQCIALMESVKRNGFCGIFLQLHKRPTMLLQNIGISFLSGNVEELFFGKWAISQKFGIRFVSQYEIVVLPYCQKQPGKYLDEENDEVFLGERCLACLNGVFVDSKTLHSCSLYSKKRSGTLWFKKIPFFLKINNYWGQIQMWGKRVNALTKVQLFHMSMLQLFQTALL